MNSLLMSCQLWLQFIVSYSLVLVNTIMQEIDESKSCVLNPIFHHPQFTSFFFASSKVPEGKINKEVNTWHIAIGRRVPSLHCASPAGSLGVLGWDLSHPGHNCYSSIQHSLVECAPIRSRSGGLVIYNRPHPTFDYQKKK